MSTVLHKLVVSVLLAAGFVRFFGARGGRGEGRRPGETLVRRVPRRGAGPAARAVGRAIVLRDQREPPGSQHCCVSWPIASADA